MIFASLGALIMNGKLLLTSVLSIFLIVGAVTAQNSVISGKVTDSAGSPVAGATVVLRNKRTGLERIATTGNDGSYSFGQLNNDEFEVIAFASGFGRVAKAGNQAGTEVSFVLEPENVREQVTVVSGSRQEELRESLNTKVDVITAADIKTTGHETVGEALRELPGVLTRRGSETAGSAGEQVQGLDSRQVLVLMDGQPLVGARGIKSGVLNLDRQSTFRLDSVEVVKGASSALYGSDAIGGVINLRTKEQTSPFSAFASVAGGNFGAADLKGGIGFKHEKLSGIFSLERHKNNGFDLDPSTFTAEGSGYHRYDAYGRLKYQFTDNFSLNGFVNSYWNNTRRRVAGETGPQLGDTDDESQNYGLNADWAINERTNLQLRGYYSRFDEISHAELYPAGTALQDGNLFERYGKFDATISRLIGERHFLQGGVEFVTDTYRGFNRLQNDEGKANTQVIWVQDKIALFDRLSLTLGGRYDHHSIFGSAVSPKVGLNFRVNDMVSLRASWGRGFRAPDLGQLYYQFANTGSFYQVIGNPDLSPEHSGSWQVGGEFHTRSRRGRLGLNFFRNDVRNLINSTSLGFIASPAQIVPVLTAAGLDPALAQFIVAGRLLFVYKNLQSVYTQGIEADASYVLPKGFQVSGAYTYLDAQDKSSAAANPYLTGRHKHQGHAKFAYSNFEYGFNANLRATFYSSWWSSATVKGDAFQLWDIYAAKTLWKDLEVYGTIDNLFDSMDPNSGTSGSILRPEAGRTFKLGLRWSFDRR